MISSILSRNGVLTEGVLLNRMRCGRRQDALDIIRVMYEEKSIGMTEKVHPRTRAVVKSYFIVVPLPNTP